MGYSESFREQAGGQAADFADEHGREDGKRVGGMIFFEHGQELAFEDNPLGT